MFEYMLRQSDQLKEAFERNELKLSGDEDNDLVFIKELILGCPVGMQHDEEMDPTVSDRELLNTIFSHSNRNINSEEDRKKNGFYLR